MAKKSIKTHLSEAHDMHACNFLNSHLELHLNHPMVHQIY